MGKNERNRASVGPLLDLNLIPVYPKIGAEKPDKPTMTLGRALEKLIPDSGLRETLMKLIEIRQRRPPFAGNYDMNQYGEIWRDTMERIGAFEDLVISSRDGLTMITSPRNPLLPELLGRFAYNLASQEPGMEARSSILVDNFFAEAQGDDPFAGLRPARKGPQKAYVNYFKNNPIPPHQLGIDLGD